MKELVKPIKKSENVIENASAYCEVTGGGSYFVAYVSYCSGSICSNQTNEMGNDEILF